MHTLHAVFAVGQPPAGSTRLRKARDSNGFFFFFVDPVLSAVAVVYARAASLSRFRGIQRNRDDERIERQRWRLRSRVVPFPAGAAAPPLGGFAGANTVSELHPSPRNFLNKGNPVIPLWHSGSWPTSRESSFGGVAHHVCESLKHAQPLGRNLFLHPFTSVGVHWCSSFRICIRSSTAQATDRHVWPRTDWRITSTVK